MDSSPKQVENAMQKSLDFTTLLSDAHSNFTESTEQLVTSQEALNSIFAKVNSTRKPGIPIPEVDFKQHEVFFYAPGEVSHGVEGLQVASVIKEKNVIAVTLVAGKSQGKYATTVMSQPCVMITYKKQGLPVVVKSAAQE
ncbi:hypothetical protein [Rasiella sp. SM2506]|uniref:hypothetical protein n=1 Tax=Rasiella sp. SM2506 TaxID=3423914 RepID=UPI003D7C0815